MVSLQIGAYSIMPKVTICQKCENLCSTDRQCVLLSEIIDNKEQSKHDREHYRRIIKRLRGQRKYYDCMLMGDDQPKLSDHYSFSKLPIPEDCLFKFEHVVLDQ